MTTPTVAWPLPPQLRFAADAAAPPARAVEVELLDRQVLKGVMSADQDLSAMADLKLTFRGLRLVFAPAEIRSVACRELLLLNELGGPVAASEQPQAPLEFALSYVDGAQLKGLTRGFLNLGAGGIYLYVAQADAHFKAIWIPRKSLQSIHINPVPPRAAPLSATARLHATNMGELATLLQEARGKPMVSVAQALFELNLVDEATFLELGADKTGKLRTYIDNRLATSEKFKRQLEHSRAYMVKMPEVNADTFEVDPQALRKISWQVATQEMIVPLGLLDGTLYLASSMPMSRALEDRLHIIANCPLALVWACEAQVKSRLARQALTLAAPGGEASLAQGVHLASGDSVVQDLPSLLAAAQKEIKVDGVEVHSTAVDERSSVVRLVKRIIMDAHQQKASDIHLETNPGIESSRVRFRIDGELEDYLKVPADLRAALVSRIKVMSKLDIAERRRPQDGKINFADFSKLKLELRVAVLPTHDNLEDVVMRLLASSKPIPLSQLGFSQRDAQIVSRMAQRPYGMILACGPTGSGKTTTLHSLLSEINTGNRKIWTAEDPIEITQPGLRQLQVNPKIGVTFASAMRAFLRADPDVIMIGEIRDEETARIAVDASLTGHLVLSTLHTNNAAESIVRLLDLGMDPMNFADSLLGLVAQRLVRALCKKCRVAEPLSAAEFERLVQSYADGTAVDLPQARSRLLEAAQATQATDIGLYHAVGCEACTGKGYKGRMGIYETVESSPELKHLIQTRAATSLIFQQAIASGSRSLKQDALEKVFAGLIDLAQAATVC
jgi:type II secretory ATPase GspE/PulE/Tfp pilus assembly ATPase PilB-like protein